MKKYYSTLRSCRKITILHLVTAMPKAERFACVYHDDPLRHAFCHRASLELFFFSRSKLFTPNSVYRNVYFVIHRTTATATRNCEVFRVGERTAYSKAAVPHSAISN